MFHEKKDKMTNPKKKKNERKNNYKQNKKDFSRKTTINI